jgi:hypothetical protein
LFRTGSPNSGLGRFLVRMAYEQFVLQQSTSIEMSRSWAMLVETAAMVGASTMTEASWRSSLGCGLDEYFRLILALSSRAISTSGWIDYRDMTSPEMRARLGSFTENQVIEIIRSQIASDFAGFQSDPGNAHGAFGLEKYRYNPLSKRPLIELGGRLLVPNIHLLEQRYSPNSLYYERVGDPGFTNELGDVTEAYVGRQLKLIEPMGARVVEKVVYDRDKKESVDWFVVFDDVLLLVEVKATRLPVASRLGTDSLAADVSRTLGKAYSQLDTTARLIRLGEKEFAHISNDRPMLGLAVTLEPYWLIWGDEIVPEPPSSLAVAPVSCYEIEQLVSAALAGPISDALLSLAASSDTGSRCFAMAFRHKPTAPNPILDAALDKILDF